MAADATKPFAPDYAVPPGESLLEVIESLGISQSDLAERAERPKKTINEIIKGKAGITPETALQFERVLGVPAAFWINLEQQYRTAIARIEERTRLEQHIEWLRDFPIKDMAAHKWVRACENRVEQLQELLNFFGVVSPRAWNDVWGDVQHAAAYRHAGADAKSFPPIAAWLRQGEIRARRVQEVFPPAQFDAARFRSELELIRGFTTTSDVASACVEVQKRCASAGVVVAYVEELPRSKVCGATRWLAPDRALLQLSLFYHRDDQFWFSFFHEAGHVLLHSKRTVFVEGAKSRTKPGLATGTRAEEEEANIFAENWLIPEAAWSVYASSGAFDDVSIRAFAADLGIAPSIVAGRLQREKLLAYDRGKALFIKLVWKKQDAA
jgi:HTH-type transcriptional regulator / antitoxin HigA